MRGQGPGQLVKMKSAIQTFLSRAVLENLAAGLIGEREVGDYAEGRERGFAGASGKERETR